MMQLLIDAAIKLLLISVMFNSGTQATPLIDVVLLHILNLGSTINDLCFQGL